MSQSNIQGKKVLLGVSGGIAAYKSPFIVRRLKEKGADVKVVMTGNAEKFIGNIALQAVSGNDVRQKLLDSDAESGMDHIELARWADLILIAPATANTIAKIVHGMADDLLTTLCLATNAPISIAPAMNQQMWENAITKRNIALAKSYNIDICGPASGQQACGETGFGRMLEPDDIVDHVSQLFSNETSSKYQDLNIILTAGPTFEPLDPVRGITNHSTGTMGYMLAKAAAELGMSVTLISGPTALDTPNNVNRINIQSAKDMYEAVHNKIGQADIFISVAAIADYRPEHQSTSKIKKVDGEDIMTLTLVKNPDILASVGNLDNEIKPYTVGFAAETDNVMENAHRKLIKKKANMIIANQVGVDKGFGNITHSVSIIKDDLDESINIGPKCKEAIAIDIMNTICEQSAIYKKKNKEVAPA